MLVITGSLAYDYIMDFPGLFASHIDPEKIHNINLSFIVKTFAKRRGGTAGNVAYTLALLQTPHKLFSSAGKDFGEYKKAFRKLGVNTEYIQIDIKTYTATGFAMTDKKDNQIWGYFYGAAENNYLLKIKTIAKKNDLVLIGPQSARGSMSIVNQSVELGVPFMFDPGFILTQVSNNDLTFGVRHAQYIIGNDYEINLIKQRVENFDLLTIKKTVITTLAEKGAMIQHEGKEFMINRVKVNQVVDPTGAGDAWRGGFLAGLERNFDLQTCGQMGAVASAYAVEHYGTQEHYYTQKEFTNRYKVAYNQNIVL